MPPVSEAQGHASGCLFVAPDGDILLLRRGSGEENFGGHWALPGGKGEDGETPEQTARRESMEEMGEVPIPSLKKMNERQTPNGLTFHTFAVPVESKFAPTLNDEHSGYAWVPLHQLPSPMHPAVQSTLRDHIGAGADNISAEGQAALRDNFLKWIAEEESDQEQAEDEALSPEVIALDRASVRSFDKDGHLRVEMTPISKAIINPYLGREIPDFERLGLQPDRVYQLLRDPAELQKAAATFAGKPILLQHKPVSANDHPREIVVGAIGGDVEFSNPYLKAPLYIWDGEAIELIESEEQRELSCGYRYRPDMTPGSHDGKPFDGVMRDIVGNHLALVKEGRAGPDVMVGDSALQSTETEKMATKPVVMSRKAAVAHGALNAYLKPKLAQDATIDLKSVLAGVTAKNFKTKRPAIMAGIKKAVEGKLAADAKIDDLDLALDAAEEIEAEDDLEPSAGMPKAGKPRGDKKAADKDCAEDEDDDEEAMDEDDEEESSKKKGAEDEEEEKIDKKAMDAAIHAAVRRERQRAAEVEAAKEDVRPHIGKISIVCDSAPEVYKIALDALKVDVTDVHPSAYKAILKAQPLPGTAASPSPTMAIDSKASKSFADRYPGAARIGQA